MCELIKRLRIEKGLTQQGLAWILGVTDGYINAVENRGSIPSYGMLVKMAEVLDPGSLDTLIATAKAESIKRATERIEKRYRA